MPIDKETLDRLKRHSKSKPTMEEIIEVKEKLDKLGNINHELLVKAIFMYERDIQDDKVLDNMYKIYMKYDISLLNDMIVGKSWV